MAVSTDIPLKSQYMKQEIQKACIGDFIITNNNFTTNLGGTAKIKAGLPGIIVCILATGRFGIRFGKGHAWTVNINNILSGEFGYFLERNQFELDNED